MGKKIYSTNIILYFYSWVERNFLSGEDFQLYGLCHSSESINMHNNTNNVVEVIVHVYAVL